MGIISCQGTPTPIQNITFLGASVKELFSEEEREGACGGVCGEREEKEGEIGT